MPTEQLYLFGCPTPKCRAQIPLPRQSHLGKFDGPSNLATDVWPLAYLCLYCGQLSWVPAKAIRQKTSEKLAQGQLFRYDFSNGRPDDLHRFVVYTLENKPDTVNTEDARTAVRRILKPSGLWRDSYGTVRQIGIEAIKDTFPPAH